MTSQPTENGKTDHPNSDNDLEYSASESEDEEEDKEEEEEETEEEEEEEKEEQQRPLKRVKSGYMEFIKRHRKQVVKDNPGMSFRHISLTLSQLWDNLSREEKGKYI
jgi:hypothetical protein